MLTGARMWGAMLTGAMGLETVTVARIDTGLPATSKILEGPKAVA